MSLGEPIAHFIKYVAVLSQCDFLRPGKRYDCKNALATHITQLP